ncbi:MAG TPA: histidine phosphatase family protein [Candidatus Binatus sp.]|nr:histidine phosphatase family protein [Candidatus Binatus sp.]
MKHSSSALTVLLVRHAEPVKPGTAGFDEFTRPLTEKGLRDADRLSETHASVRIDAAYSSPYLRARQTIEPIARARGIAIDTIDDLRERMLSAGELPDWRAHLKRSWEDFDYAPPGGESGRVAQARVIRVLDTIAMRHASGTVIVASHGNLIALALHACMPEIVDYEFWESIPMPAVFTLVRNGKAWQLDR